MIHSYSVSQFCFVLFVFCCPIIYANFRGTATMPIIWPGIPVPSHTQGSFCIVPHPERSTGGDRLMVVCQCHLKETLHCCQVTLVGFSSACSDFTYYHICAFAKRCSQCGLALILMVDYCLTFLTEETFSGHKMATKRWDTSALLADIVCTNLELASPCSTCV